jgi:uncharacterized membrane protein
MSDGGQGEERALRLEAQLAALTARVFDLEREVLSLRGTSAPSPGAAAAGAATTPAPPPPVPAPPPPHAVLQPSLESRVGSQWFNRIGIIAVLVGVAWSLKFAFENHWVGALGRVLIGLACGVALVAWSERFRARGFAGFSYSLKALGTGVLYLSLWASVSVYHLLPPGVGFAGMVVVTAWNAFVAWRQDAELLAVYAIVGAFATPLLLSTGQNEEVFLYSYLLLIEAAMLLLLVAKGWSRLLVLSFLGTVALYCGWYWNYYSPAALLTTTVFLLLFFLLFVAAAGLGRQRHEGPHENFAPLFVSLANAAFTFLGLYAMFVGPGRSGDAALAAWALGFAAFYLATRRMMQSAGGEATRWRRLEDVHLTLAIAFATLAIPLAVHGHWITVGWMAEGAGLVWLGARRRSLLLEVTAAGALLLGLVSLAIDAAAGQTQVLWNPRLLSFLAAIAATAVSGQMARRAARDSDAHAGQWRLLADVGEVTAGTLVVIAGVLEIHTWWFAQALPQAGAVREYLAARRERAQAAQFTYSAWFLLLSVLALAAGFRRDSARLRWGGLVLLAVTIVKVFLVDTSALSQGYRILSFLLLGVLLLAVSFAYQKDWLRLRAL